MTCITCDICVSDMVLSCKCIQKIKPSTARAFNDLVGVPFANHLLSIALTSS